MKSQEPESRESEPIGDQKVSRLESASRMLIKLIRFD